MRRLSYLLMLAATLLAATSERAEAAPRPRPRKSEALREKHDAIAAKIHALRDKETVQDNIKRNGAKILTMKSGMRVLINRGIDTLWVRGKATADGRVQMLNAAERAEVKAYMVPRLKSQANLGFVRADRLKIAEAFNPNKAALMELGIK